MKHLIAAALIILASSAHSWEVRQGNGKATLKFSQKTWEWPKYNGGSPGKPRPEKGYESFGMRFHCHTAPPTSPIGDVANPDVFELDPIQLSVDWNVPVHPRVDVKGKSTDYRMVMYLASRAYESDRPNHEGWTGDFLLPQWTTEATYVSAYIPTYGFAKAWDEFKAACTSTPAERPSARRSEPLVR